MPQNNLSLIARNPSNVSVPLKTDSNGLLRVNASGLTATKYATNISAVQNVSAPTTPGAQGTPAGHCVRVNVLTPGTTSGAVNDCSGTSGANGPAASNLLASIPNTVGTFTIEFPYLNGLTVTPGNGQVLAIAFT